MKREALYDAVKEAERFAKLGRQLLLDSLPDPRWIAGGKEAAQVKRSSMDLTRALVGVRKP